MNQIEIPPEVQRVADQMGVDVHALLADLQQQGQGPAQEPAAQTEAAPADTAEGVRTVPTESDTERLQRENAVLQQELQQTRALAQRADEGRVIGSGGVGPGGQQEPPNIGGIEPGIRFMYANGLISDEDLVTKVGPLLADLLKAHQGGAI